MKALSIKQPWANLIVEGIKDIENRNWLTYYRGLLYIHAGKGFDLQGASILNRQVPKYRRIIEESRNSRGGIVGTVQLTDCVTLHNSTWFYGKYGFVFNAPQKIDFYPMKGQLSIFDFHFETSPITQKTEKQLSLFDGLI
nr:ASCH domain-containing protein [uncultured Desulfobacter sp.]